MSGNNKINEFNYLKANVETYLPGFIKFLEGNSVDWDTINDLFKKKHAQRVRQFNGQDLKTLTIEATIYDIIVEVKKQNLLAINLLDYFDTLMNNLAFNLDFDERKLIVPTIKKVFTSLDMKYLNFIGEIAVLNSFVNSKLYKLIKVEHPLSNTKSLDFKFLRTRDNKIQFVEVVNIHLNDNKVIADEDQIKRFLTDRLTKKVASKKSKITEDIIFFLVPVLWGNANSLKIYSNYFSKNEIDIDEVVEPVSYITFRDENDPLFIMHRFGRISTLFKIEEKEDEKLPL